jgi:MFS transporter, DHA2 family, multidrug resistance protein
MIFVPLTTSTMGTLAQDQIGNASGIFNLMRNVGGSIGIAMITTLVPRSAQANQMLLSSHTSRFNPVWQSKLAAIQAGLAQHSSSWKALKRAPRILYGVLQQQSALLSDVHNFRIFALACILTAPLVLLFKKVAKPAAPMAAH